MSSTLLFSAHKYVLTIPIICCSILCNPLPFIVLPQVEVLNRSEDNHKMTIKVLAPKRLSCHPLFKLQSFKFEFEVQNLQVKPDPTAPVNSASSEVSLFLPIQDRPMDGQLIVATVYGNELKEESIAINVKNLPVYGEAVCVVEYSIDWSVTGLWNTT